MAIIIVSGALANKPRNGGEAWVRLSWIEGFRKLGHDVYFIEQISEKACVDRAGVACSLEDSINLEYFRQVTESFGLSGRSILICNDGEKIIGATRPELLALATGAALLVNISGNLQWAPVIQRLRRKALVDIDPGFTQFWHDAGTSRIPEHDHYFTVALNLGRPECCIPTCGIDWKITLPPVVLEQWPVHAAPDPLRLTTIASWRGAFGPVEASGKRYGVKAHEFRKFVALPSRVKQKLEIALSIHPGDQRDSDLLRENGWQTVSPADVAATPAGFRQYVQNSGGECSMAQGIYVDTNSGWFSDRTVRYLASGKPVLVQETGFSRCLPSGLGLVSFRTFDEAVAGATSIAERYSEHCVAARSIAERYFSSDVVLNRFIDDAGGLA